MQMPCQTRCPGIQASPGRTAGNCRPVAKNCRPDPAARHRNCIGRCMAGFSVALKKLAQALHRPLQERIPG